jgi:hypothetical protein
MARDAAPEFQSRTPLPSEDMEWQVPLWEYIPQSVRGEEVYKSFVYGWIQVLEAIKEIHSPQDSARHAPALPTVDAITRELVQGRYRYDHRYTDFFFRNGGKVEYAIDGLLDLAEESEDLEWLIAADDSLIAFLIRSARSRRGVGGVLRPLFWRRSR